MAARAEALLPAFAGFFFALTLAGARGEPASADLLARTPDPLAGGPPADPDGMCVRDLCRLPAIGPARALAIVRERHDHGLRGGPEVWDRIDGIGPDTVFKVRAWLDSAGARRLSGPDGGAYTSRARLPAGPRRP